MSSVLVLAWQQDTPPFFKVYTWQDHGDIPLSTIVVLHLMETGSFLGLRYLLFVDNHYTSPSLSYVAGLSVEGPQHHPHAVVDYCVSMKDVDVTDQMVNYYATTRQSKL